MSNVSGSADPLLQLKDQYALRERENETRHRDEVRELKEGQRAELDKVRSETQKQIQELQADNSAKLNQKDLQNQKEIEAVKSIYARRVAENKKPE